MTTEYMSQENPPSDEEIGLDTLSRYTLGLPLEKGVTRRQVERLIQTDPETAEVVRGMRADMHDLIELRQSWFGCKGALRAAWRNGQVSTNERLQRAWTSAVLDDPALAKRINEFIGIRTLLFQPSGAMAMAACLLLFLLPGVFIGRHTVPTPSSLGGQNYPNGGDKDLPLPSGLVSRQDIMHDLLNPAESRLPATIANWETELQTKPNDRAIREKLYELYGRVLSAPPRKLGLEAKDVQDYQTKKEQTARWLQANPSPVSLLKARP